MESKRIYQIQKRRFITTIMFHFGTVKNFCNKAGIARQRFYRILDSKYATKNPKAFVRLYNLLNDSLEDGKYDYDLFWRKP